MKLYAILIDKEKDLYFTHEEGLVPGQDAEKFSEEECEEIIREIGEGEIVWLED